ncbi:MAG: [protein-PII] uridylyltransferase [Thermodesulfobacteriota bacterium]
MNKKAAGAPEAVHSPSERLKKGRDQLISLFFEKGKSTDFLVHHAALLDQYFIECFEASQVGPRMAFHKKPYAMIALGGYGRQEQCLHSDIDILLLFEKNVPPQAEQLIREILYPLWDLGFEVGHATRSIKDCLKLAANDLDVLTALLDARFLCGMSTLYAQLRERLNLSLTGSRARKIVAGLIERNHERHGRFGDSSYLLEPNLKDGQGGLRDYHTLLWIARVQLKIIQPRDLEFMGFLSCEEFQHLNLALDFIWKVRNHLHRLTQRKFDQLYFEHQQTLAALLNFHNSHGQLAVERFLGKLHSEMAFIKETNLTFLAEASSPRPSLLRKGSRGKTDINGLKIENNQMGFVSTEHILRQPELLLRIFEESGRLKIPLSWEARRVVREFSYLADKRFRSDPRHVKIFEKILQTPAGSFNALSAMLQTGFLERFIPPVRAIKDRIQYDGYHLFPIDRHSLRTVRIIKAFATEAADAGLLDDLYRELGKRKTILLWAALLHDIGKGRAGGGHSERGARIASRILKHMGYAPDVVETVAFLIENHLFLVETATRRDTNDEETAISCARKIKDPRRLKMLYLLTVADSMATGPKAWNDWTAELLRDLFFKILNILEKGELASSKALETVDRKKPALLAAVSGKEKALLETHLEVLSPRYFLYTEAQAIVDHMRLSHQLADQPFVWRIDAGRNPNTRTVTICAKDRPGLFSKMAGVFTLNGLDILEAEIYTWKNNIALDIFTVRPPADLVYEHQRWEKAAGHLRAALAGELDLARSLADQQNGFKPKDCYVARPHRVVIDNRTSSFFTIIEVFTRDCPGLLFYITDTLFRHKLDVRVAKIGTKIDQVVDVFYVRDRDGQKVDDPDQIEGLKQDIDQVLAALLPPCHALRAAAKPTTINMEGGN